MNTKPQIDFEKGDSLDDFLGGPVTAPRQLPQDEAFLRIRARGEQPAPVAPTFKVECPKCRGRGRFIAYTGRDCGPCFKCEGRGHFERKTNPAKLAVNRVKVAERKERVRHEAVTAYQQAKPECWAWMQANAPTFEFAAAMMEAVAKFGDLTERQQAAVEKCVAREQERNANRAAAAAARNAAAPTVDVAKIVAAIQRGKANGLKWVCLRFDGVIISEAKKHPGVLYVKGSDGSYLGKIADGRFLASRDCTPELTASIVAIAADPLAAAKVYGNLTNSCCVCGRELTNKQSVEEGIGPICSQRVGWTPGGIRLQAEVDF